MTLVRAGTTLSFVMLFSIGLHWTTRLDLVRLLFDDVRTAPASPLVCLRT